MTINQNIVQTVLGSKQEEAQLTEAEEAKLCRDYGHHQMAIEEVNEDTKEASPTLQEENCPPSAEAGIQLLIKIKSQLDKQHRENKDGLPSDQLFFQALCRAVDDGHVLSALKNLTDDCTICSDPILNGAPLRYLSCCGTYFHDTDECLRGWFEQDGRCPTCQKPHNDNRRQISDQERRESMNMNDEDLISPIDIEDPSFLICDTCLTEWPSLNDFHAPPCWDCEQLLCNACVTIDRSLHYGRGRGHPTCRRCRPNPEEAKEAKEEKEEKEETKQEVDRLTQARELVVQTAINCQGMTLDDLKSEYMIITDMADLDEEYKTDDLAHRLRVNMAAVNGNRHLFLLSAYNTGVYLKIYCEEAKVSQAQAVRDLKIRGLNKNSASLFVKFAETINDFECYKFLYACRAPWRTVRALLTIAPDDRNNFLFLAFEEEGGLAHSLFEND
jgi:hypothetical protein